MKTVNMVAFELSQEEVKNLEDGTEVLIYNSLFDIYKLEQAGKNCMANSRYASDTDTLLYFTLDYPKFKEKESEM